MSARKSLVVKNYIATSGFSLVELLVALAIGLVLIAGLTYSYIGSRTTFRAQDSVSRRAENGRVALEAIARDLRQASRLGCVRNGTAPADPQIPIRANFPVMEDTPTAFGTKGFWRTDVANARNRFVRADYPLGGLLDPHKAIFAYEGGAGYTVPSGMTLTPLPSSDVVLMMKTSESSAQVAQTALPTSDIFLEEQIPGSPPGSTDQIYVVADCFTIETPTQIIRAQITSSGPYPGGKLDYLPYNVKAINQTTVNLDKPRLNTRAAWVTPFDPAVYFVAQAAAGTTQTNAPVLVRVGIETSGSNSGGWKKTPTIVAEGIESLKIVFGVTALGRKGVADTFVTPNNMTPDLWKNVVSAQVTLVVVSERDNVAEQSTTAATGGSDKRFRQTLNTTVYLRNKQ
jgi:type IV pilus assembly protein PilW